MPPSRRRPTPPVRRPRVAGLRNRPTPNRESNAPEPRVQRSGTASPTFPSSESDAPEPSAEPAAEPADTPAAEPADEPATPDLGIDPEPEPTVEPAPEPPAERATERADEPTTERTIQRPAGKRRAAGTARPADLSTAEAEAGAAAGAPRTARPAPRRKANPYAVAAVLVVAAVVLAGLAVWFRGEAEALESGDANTALTDAATTSEAIGQLTTAIEDTFSYNYTDLASTQQAVDRYLTGKARCEYDQLFGQVKELAPQQKIIMTTSVRSIGLVRLDGDRAEALVFIDQSSTRVDTNNSVAGEAQFGVLARRDGDTWKVTEFNMFDQTLVNGQPAPRC